MLAKEKLIELPLDLPLRSDLSFGTARTAQDRSAGRNKEPPCDVSDLLAALITAGALGPTGRIYRMRHRRTRPVLQVFLFILGHGVAGFVFMVRMRNGGLVFWSQDIIQWVQWELFQSMGLTMRGSC